MLMYYLNDTDYSESTDRGAMLKDHSVAEDGLTLEDVDFALAVGVWTPDAGYIHQTEDFKDHLELAVTYRTWEVSKYGDLSLHDEIIPTHECNDFADEGFFPSNDI